MSAELATLIALALFAVAAIPLVIMARWPGAARVPAYGFGLVVLMVGLVTTGTFRPRESIDFQALTAAPEANRCKRALDALIEASAVLEMPTRGELVVNSQVWDQLPAPIQETVVACAQEVDGGETAVEIIER